MRKWTGKSWTSKRQAMAEPRPDTPDPLGIAVEEAIALCDGDVHAALRAALIANSFLAAEVERLTQAVSYGFMRGRSAARRASVKLDDWREISSGEQDAT
jgi:hypothetical protein